MKLSLLSWVYCIVSWSCIFCGRSNIARNLFILSSFNLATAWISWEFALSTTAEYLALRDWSSSRWYSQARIANFRNSFIGFIRLSDVQKCGRMYLSFTIQSIIYTECNNILIQSISDIRDTRRPNDFIFYIRCLSTEEILIFTIETGEHVLHIRFCNLCLRSTVL